MTAETMQIVLDAMHKARIELGAYVQLGAGPPTEWAHRAVCEAIAMVEAEREAEDAPHRDKSDDGGDQ
jgi:hypothetical protein